MNINVRLISILLILNCSIHAENTDMLRTKEKLHQIESKMVGLQQILSHEQDKHGTLKQELSNTEKKISAGVNQLQHIQQNMKETQRKIINLQQQVSSLKHQLSTQQTLLANHVRARYAMGEYQPLKWLLNQDSLYKMNRLLTFYRYLIASREHLIAEIQVTQKQLELSQNELHQELAKEQQLQLQLNKHQQKLAQEKLYNTAIIQSLQKEIQSKQQELQEYQRNKEALENLLKSLTQHSVVKTKFSVVYMKKKLPRPVNINNTSVQKINQGVVFFAQEGQPVGAVSPGKVVFSDWLNGYGLLLIIDHGHGFMTLYAHNQSLLKHKGDTVRQGEQIATVGHSGGIKQNGLYFEIRQYGKAISPLRWLS